jgi:RNA polymerase sigma-70 factor (ECF subfamily)
MDENDDKRDNKTFLDLLIPNQRRIQAFIYALVPNITDAEDIYQESVSEMWNKFDSFEIGTDFVAWAITVAKYKVLTFRSKSGRLKTKFNNNVHEIVESAATKKVKSLQDHLDVLNDCLKKLSEKQQVLLKMRYQADMTFQKIAARTGKTAPAIHRIMSLIHSNLALCVRRTLKLEGNV